MLAHFVRYTGADKVDEVGIDAWSAGSRSVMRSTPPSRRTVSTV